MESKGENDRQKKLDALLGRALRDKEFRERLISNPTEVGKEAGLSPSELELVAGGLAIGSSLDPRKIMWCTEKTCNETGGARVVMYSPDPVFSPTIVTGASTIEKTEKTPGGSKGTG